MSEFGRSVIDGNFKIESGMRSLICAESTRASDSHPDYNEDRTLSLLRPGASVFGVFDGIGGTKGGEIASSIAKDAVRSMLGSSSFRSTEKAGLDVKSALLIANETIMQRQTPEHATMGTTAAVCYVLETPDGSKQAIVGTIGDSRVYVLRDGTLRQISVDDNLLSNDMRKKGCSESEIQEAQRKLDEVARRRDFAALTDEQKTQYRRRNVITQYLGKDLNSGDIRICTLDLKPGDKLLLATDGVSDNLTPAEISKILNEPGKSPQQLADKLRDDSLKRSRDANHIRRKSDDISAVVVSVPGSKTNERGYQPAVEIVPKFELQRGQIVRVQRSDGRIDPGWTVESVDPQTGECIVTKQENGQRFKKVISKRDLERWNGGSGNGNENGRIAKLREFFRQIIKGRGK